MKMTHSFLETFFLYVSVTVVIRWNEKHDDILVKVLKINLKTYQECLAQQEKLQGKL